MTTQREELSAEAARHFAIAAGERPAAAGRFVDVTGIAPVEMVPGLEFRPVLGEQTMVNFVRFAPHTVAPHHAHREEQIIIVLEGELIFDIDGEVRTMRVGDVGVIPPLVRHGAHTEEVGCLEIDVFNPPRETLLDHARRQQDSRPRVRGPRLAEEPGPAGRPGGVTE